MKKSFDRARIKFNRRHRKDWNPTKRMLETLNCSQALDFLVPKGEFFYVNHITEALPPLELQDYED